MEDLESKNTWVFNTEDDGPKWPLFKREIIYRLIVFLIGFVGIFFIGLAIELVVLIVQPSLLDSGSELYVQGLTLVNSFQYLFLLGAFIFFLWPRLFTLIKRFKNWKHIIIGLGFGVLVIGVTIAYNAIISQFIEMETNTNEIAAESMIKQYPVVSFFILGLVGPICEELTYRFGLFGLLKRKNRILAYIVTAFVFGIIHFDFAGDLIVELLNLPVYIMCGALFSCAYDLCGFEASVSAHVLNNLYAVIVTLLNIE